MTDRELEVAAEPVAWLVTSKSGMVRTAWTTEPDEIQRDVAHFDGDTITPLYESPPSPQWLPISSAPKDGAIIDLWRNGERLTSMRRVTHGFDNVYYEPTISGPCCVRDATHWMPLPPPPTNEPQQ